MALPTEVVSAFVEEELPAVRAWAEREGVELDYLPDRPALRFRLQGPAAEPAGTETTAALAPEHYLLQACLDDYRELPPDWHFLHPDSGEEVGLAAFPAQPSAPIGGTSLFLPMGGNPVICAHFSRRSYGNGAPHPDWQPAQWQNASPGYVLATTLGDMVNRIAAEVAISNGRMEPLP